MANVSPLEEVAISGDIDRLYALIEVDPHILERVDAIPFVDTLLHVAASAGHLHFATEIMRLKPSFALKLNPQGFSPIHLALQKGHKKLVQRFVDINKDLVRVRGREGITPLHFVSQTGDIDLLAKFLSACPDSIEDVNVRSETALHIAVKHQQFEALHVLVGWLMRNIREGADTLEVSILNWKDEAGNTILHLSALYDDIQALDLLTNCKMMNLNAKNSENSTALDIAASTEIERKLFEAGAQRGSSVEGDPTLAHQLRSKITVPQQIGIRIQRTSNSISDKQREAYLVVAVLLLTAMYQTALSPPGGVYQADNGANNLNTTSSLNFAAIATTAKAGKSVLTSDNFYLLSYINSAVLLFTTVTIFILIPRGWVGIQLTALTIYFAVSYVYSVQLISPMPGIKYTGAYVTWSIVVTCMSVLYQGMNPAPSKILKKKILRRLKITRT